MDTRVSHLHPQSDSYEPGIPSSDHTQQITLLRSLCPQQPPWHNRFKSRELSSPVTALGRLGRSHRSQKDLSTCPKVLSFVDPEGTGHAEPSPPPKVTLVVSTHLYLLSEQYLGHFGTSALQHVRCDQANTVFLQLWVALLVVTRVRVVLLLVIPNWMEALKRLIAYAPTTILQTRVRVAPGLQSTISFKPAYEQPRVCIPRLLEPAYE